MNREAERKLRFDRRLRERLGWVDDAEFEAELASLPDVSHKMAPVDPPGDQGAEEPAGGAEN